MHTHSPPPKFCCPERIPAAALHTTAAASIAGQERTAADVIPCSCLDSLLYLTSMSMLEVITKASSAIPTIPDHESSYPIVFNPDPIFSKLKPEVDDQQTGNSVKKVTGWEISQIDNDLLELGQSFFKKLKDTRAFGKDEFFEMITSHLEKVGAKIGVSLNLNKQDEGYVYQIVEKLGVLLGRDAKGLILEDCIALEAWDLLGTLLVNGIVGHSFTSYLVSKLIEKRRSDLIVLCVKHLLDLQSYDILCILKYFLMLPVDGYKSLTRVREEWEWNATLAIDLASGKGVSGKDSGLAKEAAVLVMLAHDGFSVSELCLHYMLASPNLDEVIFSACVGKLNGEEMKGLVRYLGKWLRKYERFPQVVPCPKASSVLGLRICDWIPTLENITKCLGVVVDEHFSSLVLHNELDELRSLVGVVSSLADEAKLCGTLANLAERLRTENQAYSSDAPGSFAF